MYEVTYQTHRGPSSGAIERSRQFDRHAEAQGFYYDVCYGYHGNSVWDVRLTDENGETLLPTPTKETI